MNLKQHRFVTEYLRHRDAMTAYSIAYNYQTSNYQSLQSAANRLFNHPEVSEAIERVERSIRTEVEAEIKAQLKVELLTLQTKRELLAKIATGQMQAVQTYKGKDCSQCTQVVYPTINQMLKAIDLDNKLAGHYAADKRQFSVEKSQQNTTNHGQAPLLFLGGDIGDAPPAQKPIGVVDSRSADNTPEPQQNTTKIEVTPSLLERGPGGEAPSHSTNNIPASQQNTTIPPDKTPSPIKEKGSEKHQPPFSTCGEGPGVRCSNSAYPPYQQVLPIRQTQQT